MTKYLAGVLTVIAVGVLAIAYGLIVPRAIGFDVRAAHLAGQPVALAGSLAPDASVRSATAGFVNRDILVESERPRAATVTDRWAEPEPSDRRARAIRTVVVEPEPEVVTREVVREPRRNWKKTAMIIGGSTAAGAGLGGIMGGKKGALIGAAIGGGASTIYETTK